MSKQGFDLSKFASRLNALKREVENTADLARDAARTVELDQNRVGRLSRIDAMQGQAMAQANAQRHSLLLIEIDRAIEEIASGDYGRCIECDYVIAEARLMVDPVVQTCIVCATSLEQT